MDLNINLNVPALEKLIDYTVSGIGSVTGLLFASWKAQQESNAKLIATQGEAESLKMIAKAQLEVRNTLATQGEAESLKMIAKAQLEVRNTLVSQDSTFTGDLDISSTINQRLQFQQEKRQKNIEFVVQQAALQLGDKSVPDSEPDHDWTARFFNDVQDVSSEEMQSLWVKVLAGEVERAGNTSIRTLGILKNMDQATARLFRILCSACVFLTPDGQVLMDARVPSLGGKAASNSLEEYGLNFGNLNILNESGLIISDYNSWFDYRLSIGTLLNNKSPVIQIPFRFQNRYWVLVSTRQNYPSKEFKLSGVALSQSGIELSKIVGLEVMDKFSNDLQKFLQKNNLQMTEVDSWQPRIVSGFP